MKTQEVINEAAYRGLLTAYKDWRMQAKGWKLKPEYKFTQCDDYDKAKEAAKNCKSDEFGAMWWAARQAVVSNKLEKYEKVEY